ncbi:MAG: hypothetical protein B7Z15_16275, partial [Rhizobiales bacterium 32-66-8]
GTQLLQVLVLMVPPLRDMLSLEAMTLMEGLELAVVGILVIGIMEIYKWARRRRGGDGLDRTRAGSGDQTPSKGRGVAANAL